MIPVNFDYAQPSSIEEAQALIAAADPSHEVAILAGGQSLLTALKHRRMEPGLVVDISNISKLNAPVREARNQLCVSAMMRQSDFIEDRAAAEHTPIFLEVAAAAADPMLRRRGTVVGAFCEADPFGDWVPAGLVHNTKLDVLPFRRAGGVFSRSNRPGKLKLEKRDLAECAMLPKSERFKLGEIVTAAYLEKAPNGARHVYRKAKHAAIGWSIASVAILAVVKDSDAVSEIRVAASGALSAPSRLTDLEKKLVGVRLSETDKIQQYIQEQLEKNDFVGDQYASKQYRAKRLAVEIRRALATL